MEVDVLVLCTANRCRSQMAEGWLRYHANEHMTIASAGVKPSVVHPLAIKVMSEAGIDLSTHHSKHINEFIDKEVGVVVTVCNSAKEQCPVLPGAIKVLHQPFDDPDAATGNDEEILSVFRRVRDEIGLWAKAFIDDLPQNGSD